MRTRVKICGLTRLSDAVLAEKLGAWALGFVFYPQRPRAVGAEQVQKITEKLGPAVKKVGVFVDESRAEIEKVVRQSGLSAVQLHGDESVDFCADLKKALPQIEIFKALRKPGHEKQYSMVSDAILIDASSEQLKGGTGKLADWAWAKALSQNQRVILAGGLSAENARQAMREVQPYALDLSSGVELSPGIKSDAKLEQLFSILKTGEISDANST
jgi:phosphoribosylanthranilate isomerase